MNAIFPVCISLLVLPSLSIAEEKPEKPKTTAEYIQKTGRLSGISEVRLSADGTVVLVDAITVGNGFPMRMVTADHEVVNEMTLRVSQTCTLAERHVSLAYQLKEAKDGSITFEMTETFDARSFGGELKKQVSTFTIKPYSEPRTKPQAGPGK